MKPALFLLFVLSFSCYVYAHEEFVDPNDKKIEKEIPVDDKNTTSTKKVEH